MNRELAGPGRDREPRAATFGRPRASGALRGALAACLGLAACGGGTGPPTLASGVYTLVAIGGWSPPTTFGALCYVSAYLAVEGPTSVYYARTFGRPGRRGCTEPQNPVGELFKGTYRLAGTRCHARPRGAPGWRVRRHGGLGERGRAAAVAPRRGDLGDRRAGRRDLRVRV
jgi:hypothetical protein